MARLAQLFISGCAAEEADLVAVPPFQMLQLQDLITAIHGWVRYRLSVCAPHLIIELDSLYEEVTGRSLEQEARAKDVSLNVLRTWLEEGRFILDLQPADYIHYFEHVTDIVLRAGYQGLSVLPDEIQQYIEPRVQRSDDPIAPLFNLVQMLATRERYLNFGFILVIPLKEIGVIREACGRDDLLHRMRELSLDLTSVYDLDFAARLWHLLAQEFGYQDISHDIVTMEALDALGEIASRKDLSNGPRTVVNAFRRIVERYKTYGAQVAPYTPLDLVEDLIAGAIQFAGNNQIQNVTRRALQSAIVRKLPERYEPAIKLAAAYPSAGVPLSIQQKYHVVEALDELMQQALGELVIAIGPIDDHGITLFGLQVGNQQIEWLAQTIRDFRRAYGEHHASTQERAVKVFSHLLRSKVFNSWNLVEERQANFTSNHSLILEGDFQSFSSRYPKRRIHVRIFWEDEERKDADIDGDVAIEFHLSVHPEMRNQPNERRNYASEVKIDYEHHTAMVPINLMYVRPEGIPPQIQQKLQDVWSPYDLSPLVLMNIYQMLEEKRENKVIPRSEDSFIASGFQPDLLDAIIRDLFNAQVGSSLGGVSQGRIVETAVETLLDARYSDTYHTVMNIATWRSSLQRYGNAISQLNNPYQRRGEIEVEGSKKEIADMMAYSNVALDNFIKTFNDLITVTRDWRGGEVGAVRFTLHALETKILHWLRESSKTDRVSLAGTSIEVHCINTGEIFSRAQKMGYKSEEVDELLKLLAKRGVVEFHQTYLLREVPSQMLDLDDVTYQMNDFMRDLQTLMQGFPGNNRLTSIHTDAQKWQQAIEKEREMGAPDPERVYRLGRNIQIRHNELRDFSQDKQGELIRQLNAMRQGLRPINPQHLSALSAATKGLVSYVDQVNALRRTVLTFANGVKSGIDSLNIHLEKVLSDVKQENLSYDMLTHCAADALKYEVNLETVKNRLEEFDNLYRHLNAWQTLVEQGSDLLDDLQQMGQMTSVQITAYEQLAREISGKISSASNKLDVLPDHSIYANRLHTLREDTRHIRQAAETSFVELQNRYYQSLLSNNLYKRDQIGHPLTYNLSNPGESYRLLYERVQAYIREVTRQLTDNIQDCQREVQNILVTPLIQTLPTDDREQIGVDGQTIIQEAKKTMAELSRVEQESGDISKIQGFSQDGKGVYVALLQVIVDGRDKAAEIYRRTKQLSEWLIAIKLSPEEELVLERLPIEDLESTIDLVEWRSRVSIPPEEFWRLLRSLYEKRYIRLNIGRVRR